MHHLKKLVFLSLISTLLSCQTLGSSDGDKKDVQIKDLISAKLSLIKTLLDKGQTEEAWGNLRPMLQAYPQDPAILNMAGLTHLALANPKRALSLFRSAYKEKPSGAIGLNLSSALIAAGRPASARAVLKKLLATKKPYPYRERLWHNLALTYEKELQPDVAERYYRKALRENPSYYLTLMQLAHLYKAQQKNTFAMKYYAEAMKHCRTCFAPLNEIATVYLAQGQYTQAISLLRRFLGNKNDAIDHKEDAEHLLQLAQRIKAQRTARRP